MSVHVNDRVGCLTVLEVLENATALERDLRGYKGCPPPLKQGAQALVRCDCLLEFLVRARELSRRKQAVRCGNRCELGGEPKSDKLSRLDRPAWTNCRSPLCEKQLKSGNRTGFCTNCQRRYPGKRWYVLACGHLDLQRQTVRRSVARLEARRRDAGICIRCCLPAAEGRRRCAQHLDEDSRGSVERRRRRRARAAERMAA